MKKLALVAAAAMIAILAPATAAQAGADTRPCVTLGEWLKVEDGMSMRRVHDIFDTGGHYQPLVSDPWYDDRRDVWRDYPVCPGFNRGIRVEIWYDNYWYDAPGLRVYSKDARP